MRPGLVGAIVLLVALGGCGGRDSTPAGQSAAAERPDGLPRVRVAFVRHAGPTVASFPTYLEAEREADLVAETEGDVLAVKAREGTRVSVGDTLIGIDDRDERLTFDRDQAEYDWAMAEARRLEALRAEGHVSARDLEQAGLNVDRARAALGLARAALDRCWVRAPIAGLVWMVRVEPHQRVVLGQPLMRVTDPSEVRTSVYLPEALRPLARIGRQVRVECDRARTPMTATIRRVDPVTDPASGTFRITASFRRRPGDPEPGADVRLLLPAAGGDRRVLLPEGTHIEGDGDSTWVWRCDGNRVQRIPVRIGTVHDGVIQVEAGLPDGAMVVMESSRPLADGALVEVERSP